MMVKTIREGILIFIPCGGFPEWMKIMEENPPQGRISIDRIYF